MPPSSEAHSSQRFAPGVELKSPGASGSLSPAETSTPATAADQMFLSPRVIDRRTYEEFGAELRELASSASQQRAALTAALDSAKSLDERASLAARTLTARLEQAVKLVPVVDQRLARLEQLLGSPPELLADQRRRALEKAEAEIAARLAKIVDEQAQVQAARFQAQLARTIEEQVDGAVRATLGQSVDDARELARTLDMLIADGESRLTQLIDTAQNQSDAARAAEEGHAAAFEERIQGVIQRCEAELATLLTEARSTGHQLLSHTETAKSTLEQAHSVDLGKLRAALDALQEHKAALNQIPTLSAGIEAAAAKAREAEFAARQFDELVKQADHARRQFGETLLKGAAAMDTLELRLEAIQASMTSVEQRGDAIAQLGDTARQLETVQSQARAFADHALAMGQWLAGIVTQAQAAGNALCAGNKLPETNPAPEQNLRQAQPDGRRRIGA